MARRTNINRLIAESPIPQIDQSPNRLGAIEEFTDSGKSTSIGREDVSHVIEADTATTAIVHLVYKDYDPSNVLQSTEQDRYRMAASGTLSLISVDLQYGLQAVKERRLGD